LGNNCPTLLNVNHQVYALEKKYHALHNPLYQQRASITDGKHEPTDEEAVFPLADTDSEDEDRFVQAKKRKIG